MSSFVILSVSCASANGTRQMSAEDHEARARLDQQRAAESEARAQLACPAYESADACFRYWTSFRNPTRKQLEQAAKYRADAERHRSASQALRDAEANACVGVPPADRDVSPFFHVEDIVRVDKVSVDSSHDVLTGAKVLFRPLPGMTPALLQKMLDCHLARNAVVGYGTARAEGSPLAAPGLIVFVHAVADGLAVDVRPSESEGSRILSESVNVLIRAKHLDEHERSATDLARFEDVACGDIPASSRAACPMLGPAIDVLDVPGGVSVRFVTQARVDGVLASMKCHMAYARAHEFLNSADCPLYLPGVEIRRAADPRAIEIISPDASKTSEVRRLSRQEAVLVHSEREARCVTPGT
jgi:hypothetical protein